MLRVSRLVSHSKSKPKFLCLLLYNFRHLHNLLNMLFPFMLPIKLLFSSPSLFTPAPKQSPSWKQLCCSYTTAPLKVLFNPALTTTTADVPSSSNVPAPLTTLTLAVSNNKLIKTLSYDAVSQVNKEPAYVFSVLRVRAVLHVVPLV